MRDAGLALRGALHEDGGTLLLLGPDEPAFWTIFTSAPEHADGAPDPLDRWSKRVIGALAQDWGGTAIFPSDRPFAPFLQWAVDAGTAWASPVHLLVHEEAGLWASYRGAIRITTGLPLPPQPQRAPCEGCAAPCTTACPIGALTPDGYDVAACKAHVRSPEGAACRAGCLVRQSCPVSQRFGRDPAQSAFHMAAFAQG